MSLILSQAMNIYVRSESKGKKKKKKEESYDCRSFGEVCCLVRAFHDLKDFSQKFFRRLGILGQQGDHGKRN